jgi:hypothetical protein
MNNNEAIIKNETMDNMFENKYRHKSNLTIIYNF